MGLKKSVPLPQHVVLLQAFVGVGTTGALGAGAPLDLAILYGERLIEIIAKCVI